MEGTNKNQGPESPADLEWSQGAKNPRKVNEAVGTLSSDTTAPTNENFVSEYAAGSATVDGTSSDETVKTTNANIDDTIITTATQIDHRTSTDDTDISISDTPKKSVKDDLKPFVEMVKARSNLYNEIIKKPFMIMYIKTSQEKFTVPEFDSILNKIHFGIVNLADSQSEIIPRINSHRKDAGICIIYCQDKPTLNFVKSVDYKSALPECDFRVLVPAQILTPMIARVKIPGPKFYTDEYFVLFEKQNAGIETEYWNELERLETSVGVELKLEIDFMSWENIKKSQMMLFCGASKVLFKTGKQ